MEKFPATAALAALGREVLAGERSDAVEIELDLEIPSGTRPLLPTLSPIDRFV